MPWITEEEMDSLHDAYLDLVRDDDPHGQIIGEGLGYLHSRIAGRNIMRYGGGVNMARMIDADAAIRIFEEMIRAREKNCSRSAIIELGAFKYAIEVINRLAVDQPEDER